MSDERLRELERRWKETGSVGDEAAFLLERVRAGELTQERLELAAYCGHEGAGVATGTAKAPHAAPLETLVQKLREWGAPALVAAAGGAALACVEVYGRARPGDDRPHKAAAAAAAWSACPCDEHAQLARFAIGGADEASLALAHEDQQASQAARAAVSAAIAAVERHITETRNALYCAAQAVPETVVIRAVQVAVGEWALGAGSP